MLPPVKDYAWRRRDSRWERELAQLLRMAPESERLQFVQEFAVANPAVALELARKCLTERGSFEALLDQGLEEANSSSLRYWLECVVPRLGFRRVVAILRSQLGTKADRVAQAAYWLPTFSGQPGFSRSDVEALRAR